MVAQNSPHMMLLEAPKYQMRICRRKKIGSLQFLESGKAPNHNSIPIRFVVFKIIGSSCPKLANRRARGLGFNQTLIGIGANL